MDQHSEIVLVAFFNALPTVVDALSDGCILHYGTVRVLLAKSVLAARHLEHFLAELSRDRAEHAFACIVSECLHTHLTSRGTDTGFSASM